MITRKLIAELRGDKYRRRINLFSAILLVIFAAFFGYDVWNEKLDTANEASQRVVNALSDEQPVIPNEQTVAPEVVVNQLELQLQNTNETTDTEVMPATETTTAISTATPRSSSTPLPAYTAAPTTTNVSASAVDGQVYYVVVSANLRPCPYVNDACAVTTSLRKGTGINVMGEVQGDAFQGSTLWYSIEYNGQSSFVHSALVSSLPPTP